MSAARPYMARATMPPSTRGAREGDQTFETTGAAAPHKSLWRILCKPSAPQTVLTTPAPPNIKRAAAAKAETTTKETLPEDQLIEDSATQSQKPADEPDADEGNGIVSQIVSNPSVMLSGEQKAILHTVLTGDRNIFFTGAAGTGKSVLLRCIISQLRSRYRRDEIAVTALTGIAACNIGGMTLHRFAGIGLGQDTVENHIRQIQRNQRSMGRWRNVKVLLVDEVSMLRSDLLEKLEAIARGVRGNNIKFGGIQLVFTGDLFQLPPVPDRYGQGAGTQQQYCFESEIWSNLIDRTVNLTQVFRQADPAFASVLNDLRVGQVKPETAELFRSLVRPPRMPKGIVPTKLFPRRKDVNVANDQALLRLDGTTYEYDCYDEMTPDGQREKVNLNITSLAEERVRLKLGAQVMMIKNIDDTIVNGSIGKIVAFMSAEDMGLKERRSTRNNVQSDDFNPNDEEPAKAYPPELLGAYGNSEIANRKRRLAEQLSLKQAESTVVWPVVRFGTREGTIRYMMVRPETWSVTDSQDNVIASRTQIPLLLAWALSIHKAQGQTLPYVSVNLQHIFEKGQAYVAISRATCIDGLQIHRFNEKSVMVDTKVLEFYEGLDQVSAAEIANAETYFKDLDYQRQKPRARVHDEQGEAARQRRRCEPVVDFVNSDDIVIVDNSSDPSWQSDGSEPMFSSDGDASQLKYHSGQHQLQPHQSDPYQSEPRQSEPNQSGQHQVEQQSVQHQPAQSRLEKPQREQEYEQYYSDRHSDFDRSRKRLRQEQMQS